MKGSPTIVLNRQHPGCRWGLSVALSCILSLSACETLKDSLAHILPGILSVVATELYDALIVYEHAAANPPLTAAEGRIYTALQISRANTITDRCAQLKGHISEQEVARIRAIIAPHAPQIE